MTEGALARLSGVSQPTIHRILSGESQNPKRSTLEPIARVFGRGVEDLYTARAKPAPPSLDERAQQFVEAVSALTDEQADLVLQMIRELRKAR